MEPPESEPPKNALGRRSMPWSRSISRRKASILGESWCARAAFLTYRPGRGESKIFRRAIVTAYTTTMGMPINLGWRFLRMPEGSGPAPHC